MAENGRPPPPDDDGPSRKATILGIIAAAFLLAGMIWLAQIFIQQQKLEECVQSGRRNCVEIERPN